MILRSDLKCVSNDTRRIEGKYTSTICWPLIGWSDSRLAEKAWVKLVGEADQEPPPGRAWRCCRKGRNKATGSSEMEGWRLAVRCPVVKERRKDREGCSRRDETARRWRKRKKPEKCLLLFFVSFFVFFLFRLSFSFFIFRFEPGWGLSLVCLAPHFFFLFLFLFLQFQNSN